jgi:hypothetical protein
VLRRLTLSVAVPVTVAGLLAFAACKSSSDQGDIEPVWVTDPFAQSPAVTTIALDGISSDGGVTSLVPAQALSQTGQTTIDMGNLDESDTYAIRFTGFGADGGTLVQGETLPIELGAIAASTLPVFVQRTGTLAQMPVQLPDSRTAPLLGILGGEYIFEAGGTSEDAGTTTNLYDLIAYTPLADPPSFAYPPLSMALSDLQVLVIATVSGTTSGTWLDTTTGDTTAATLPSGSSATWDDVAGGLTVLADDGTEFIIGATRQTGAPTAAILVVSTSQTLSWASLNTPRLGAAAGWAPAVGGLVVAGGSTTGAGVELLGEAATLASNLSYATDPSTGGGLDALDSSHMLYVAGSSAHIIDLKDLGCDASTCTEGTWDASLPVSLSFAQVFDIDTNSAFVVGESEDGGSLAYRVSSSAVEPIPFAVSPPPAHARGVRLPMGPIAVVGGSTWIESFTP